MFPKLDAQPDFAAQEEKILDFWQENDIFAKSVARNEGKEPFIIYDGPPTANAKPPLHTIVPISFKDLVGRYKTMRGHFVPRQAGWDTHGLPVEVQVEKAMGIANKKDILNLVPGDEAASIKQFNATCKKSVWEFKQEWDKFVPRLGYWLDTEHPYVTYEPGYIEGVWKVFKEISLLEDGKLLYKGHKVVPYCPRCGTTLSAAEVASGYEDIKDTSVYVSFPLTEDPTCSILAWTTTPWTLPGNVALAVGPEIDYVRVRQVNAEDQTQDYILAKARLEILRKQGEFEIIEHFKGKELVGKTYLPIFPEALQNAPGKRWVVVPASFVTTEDGTGIVHTAVMYGEDDFNLGLAEGLTSQHTVDTEGNFLSEVIPFSGLNVREALVPILKELASRGRLYAKEVITHSYPHCWRCTTPLIYYAKDSWFIRMSAQREQLLNANKEVGWIPEHIKEGRFGDFIREARDWAVSRERFWGTPVPIWIAKDGDYLVIGSFTELKEHAKDPSLITSEFDPHRPFVDEIVLVKDGKEYFHEPLVLDVWFDSGSMPFASGREDLNQFPANYIAEAIDQTRGWFYTLMAISTLTRGQSAYKQVVCMGHMVDEHGKKMSKSVGNILDPSETFKICGVDAIRWYIYSVNSPGETKNFGAKELQTSFRKTLLLLWNVFNYFLTYANLAGHDQTALANPQAKDFTPLDKWLLSRQADVAKQVTVHMEAYDFMRASRLLDNYINDLSTWYLRRSRKRIDLAFFSTMYQVLYNLSIWLAPFTPFMAEQIYQALRTEEMPLSVHLVDWLTEVGEPDPSLEEAMFRLRQAIELGLAIRAEEGIKVRQPLARFEITEQPIHTRNPRMAELVYLAEEELNVLEVVLVDELTEGLLSRDSQNLGVAFDIQMTDDLLQAGLARDLTRQLQQLRKEKGLQPGQLATLIIDPNQKGLIKPLLEAFPEILNDSFFQFDPATNWQAVAQHEIKVGEETVFIDIR